jgi:hypothetical protein
MGSLKPMLLSVINRAAVRIESKRSLIELLIYRCSTPCSVMHTAATVIVPHTANGFTHDKRWAMEDAVYSSQPRFIRLRSD